MVRFAQPVVLPASTDQNWDFTIASGGQACMHFYLAGTSSDFSSTSLTLFNCQKP